MRGAEATGVGRVASDLTWNLTRHLFTWAPLTGDLSFRSSYTVATQQLATVPLAPGAKPAILTALQSGRFSPGRLPAIPLDELIPALSGVF